MDNTVTRYSRHFHCNLRGEQYHFFKFTERPSLGAKKCQDYFSPVLSPSDADFSWKNDIINDEDCNEDDEEWC